jgi:hypothetical protein
MNVWTKLRALFIKPDPEPEPRNITWPEEFERLRQIRETRSMFDRERMDKALQGPRIRLNPQAKTPAEIRSFLDARAEILALPVKEM